MTFGKRSHIATTDDGDDDMGLLDDVQGESSTSSTLKRPRVDVGTMEENPDDYVGKNIIP